MDEADGEGWGQPPPERLKIRKAFCRKAAEQLLRRRSVTSPPVPVEEIAEALGYETKVVDMPRGVDARLRITGQRRLIELAKGQARARHRFSIAHELGHGTLGHLHGDTDVGEQEANAFAGALLVPPTWLKANIGVFSTVDMLAHRYGVSRHVIFIASEGARVLDRLK